MSPFGTLEVLEITTEDPFERGLIHGKTLRTGVQRMAELRMALMLSETDFKSEKEVDELSREHLPILERFDNDLYQELLGIAEGASLSPEKIVVINHYTDMRDIRKGSPQEGGCSVIYMPKALLGQTWDVHGSATEHVFVLKLKDQLLLSVAGCLGMTGMNQSGVGITINNLSSIDAKVGVVWPALVRKVLKQKSANDGKDVVMDAPLGSGHHYVIADKESFFAIETSGQKKKITQDSAGKSHIHTNHCLDDEMRATHVIRKTSTTLQRFDGLEQILKENTIDSPAKMYEELGRVSMPFLPEAPEKVATCGALIMDLSRSVALACKGPPSERYFHNTPISLELT